MRLMHKPRNLKKMQHYFVSLNKDNGKYDVVEKPTEQIINTFDKHDKATKVSRSLNSGKGFCGNTPSFFLIRCKVPKS